MKGTIAGIGGYKTLVMLMIARLGAEAYGVSILDQLREVLGKEIDHTQVYGTLKKLKREGYVVEAGVVESEIGGPPRKMVALTEAGREALADARDYYVAMGRVLSDGAVEARPEVERSERG